ncbi:MAG: hypothetical protein K9H48_07710 [Melioribacteraceae bacterium]|nr:hypothetical protein [Melioribacteraceae bacterium]
MSDNLRFIWIKTNNGFIHIIFEEKIKKISLFCYEIPKPKEDILINKKEIWQYIQENVSENEDLKEIERFFLEIV